MTAWCLAHPQATFADAAGGSPARRPDRGRCSACGAELSPLAEALDLGASHYSPWLVESAALLGSERTFQAAARLGNVPGWPASISCPSTAGHPSIPAG
jgi:hypothetical protein